MQVLLVGNYGVENLGDEALRQYFLREFPAVEWRVVSAHPQADELPRLPLGFRSFFAMKWPATLRAYRQCDAVVLGGGSLFTDVESLYAGFLWAAHVLVARFFGKPVHLVFQGVGPFRTRLGAWCARYAVVRAATVSVRDQQSFDRARQWRRDIVLGFDPVFTILQSTKEEAQLPNESLLIVIPRANSGEAFFKQLALCLSAQRFSSIRVVSMQPDAETAIVAQIKSHVSIPVEVVLVRSLEALHHAISGGGLVLSHRYHGALAAMAAGISLSIVPQSNGDKLSSLQLLIDTEPAGGRKERLKQRIDVAKNQLVVALDAMNKRA